MKTKYIALIALSVLSIVSCDDYLNFEKPGTTLIKDAFNTPTDAVASVTAAYTPLMWEFGYTYFPEWWIGDVCSDDALKGGGSLSDMDLVYEMENFKTRSDNEVLLRFYRAQYIGAFRCNLVLENVPQMDPAVFKEAEAGLQNRVAGEALYLRACYHFRLVRVFGGLVLADRVIEKQSEWKQPRVSEEQVYEMIYSDLNQAIQYLPEKSKYKADDLGRATKGAARALLMKACMNNHQYADAKLQGDSIINSGEYRLCPNYDDNFTVEGENGPESLFEIQYVSDNSSDWGTAGNMGFSRGSFTVLMTRPRWAVTTGGGWGFNRPTQELYDEFEAGDLRRDAAIYSPTLDQAGASDDNTMNIDVYLGNRYTARKYSMMNADTTWIDLEYELYGFINRKEIRYSDVLLMYAEACCETGNIDRAKWALEEVRKRARNGNNAILPPFPYGNYADNQPDLVKAIRHERRVELAMEGHRWFDLKRWGVLAEVMNNYRATTKPQIATHIAEFVKGKHELFPIPLQERDLNSPMTQNPGYDGVPVAN